LAAARRPAELLAIPPYDRSGRFEAYTDAAALVEKRALGGYAPHDILGGQYRCHYTATPTRRFAYNAIVGVKRF
jgi:hypothetical protein